MADGITRMYQDCVHVRSQIDSELETLSGGVKLDVARTQRLQQLERQFGEAYKSFAAQVQSTHNAADKRRWDRYVTQLADDKTSIRQSLEPYNIQVYAK